MTQEIAPAVRIVNPIDEHQLVSLKGTVHPLANARNDRGAAPDEMQLERMHLVLKRSNSQEAALRTLIGQIHTPGTASYHKWLTPDQFGKQFGPADQDITAVETWLTGHGFSVTKVNPGKQTIEFSGNVAQMRGAFHTQIHKYEVNGETHYANAGDPQIPAAVAPVVGGFVSLNNFRAKSYVKYLGKAQYDPKTDHATPEWTTGSSAGYNFVLAPGDFAVQYDLNPLYTAGTNGSGQTIAIINESNVNIGVVNSFRSLFSLPANPPQVIIDGNDPGVDGINNPDGPNGASTEAYLDVEWAGAVAPDATVDLVIAANTAMENGLILAAEHAVYSNVAPIMSVSFGLCENFLTPSGNSFLSALWEQAAAQGITVVVSTGDNGAAGCDNDNSEEYAIYGQQVNGYASTPYNVAVGGTDFYYSDFSQGLTAMEAQMGTYWNTTASNHGQQQLAGGVHHRRESSHSGATMERQPLWGYHFYAERGRLASVVHIYCGGKRRVQRDLYHQACVADRIWRHGARPSGRFSLRLQRLQCQLLSHLRQRRRLPAGIERRDGADQRRGRHVGFDSVVCRHHGNGEPVPDKVTWLASEAGAGGLCALSACQAGSGGVQRREERHQHRSVRSDRRYHKLRGRSQPDHPRVHRFQRQPSRDPGGNDRYRDDSVVQRRQGL
jgi:hypothetical protein